MSLAAFQKLWFTIASAQLGFDGASNWDLYWSAYDRTKNEPVVLDDRAAGGGLGALSVVLRVPAAPADDGSGLAGARRSIPWTVDDQATRYDTRTRTSLEQELTAYAGPTAS